MELGRAPRAARAALRVGHLRGRRLDARAYPPARDAHPARDPAHRRAHLTCVGAPREEILDIARAYWDEGVRHLVALRGDPPHGRGRLSRPRRRLRLCRRAGRRAARAWRRSTFPSPPTPRCTRRRAPPTGGSRQPQAQDRRRREPRHHAVLLRHRGRSCAFATAARRPASARPSFRAFCPSRASRRCCASPSAAARAFPPWLHERFEGLEDDAETRRLIAAERRDRAGAGSSRATVCASFTSIRSIAPSSPTPSATRWACGRGTRAPHAPQARGERVSALRDTPRTRARARRSGARARRAGGRARASAAPFAIEPLDETERRTRIERLKRLLGERIVLLDGAMGTMIQQRKLDEAGFRGERLRAHGRDLRGNNDILTLTRPEVDRRRAPRLSRRGRRHHRDQHLQLERGLAGRLRHRRRWFPSSTTAPRASRAPRPMSSRSAPARRASSPARSAPRAA